MRLIPVLIVAAYGFLLLGSICHPVYAPSSRISDVSAFLAMVLVLAAVSILGRTPPENAPSPARWDIPLLLMLVSLYGSFALQIYFGIDIGNRSAEVQNLGTIAMCIAGICLLPYFALIPSESPFFARIGRLAGPLAVFFVLGLGVLLKVDGVMNERRAMIDVWEVMQSGGKELAHGLNPYATRIPSAEAAGRYFGNPPSTYVYPPSVLLLTLPAVRWAGDVRYMYIIADLAAAILLILIGRRLRGGSRMSRYAEIAAVLVMFHPLSFAKAWNDLIIVPFLCGYVLASLKNPYGWIQAVLAGFTVSIKQYLAFLVPLLAVRLEKRRLLLVSFAAAVATAVPFLVWNPVALFKSVVVFHFNTPFRDDGMTLGAFLHHVFGIGIPASAGAVAALLLAAAACLFTPRRGLAGTMVWTAAIYLALFFGSSYAFPNYYQFVMGVLLIGALLTLSERNSRPDDRDGTNHGAADFVSPEKVLEPVGDDRVLKGEGGHEAERP
jgi:hypothetical protein